LAALEAIFAANEGFIDFDDTASTAHRREYAGAHSLADTVGKEPRGFHAARKHPLNLIGRDSFLASAHKVNDLKPKAQWKMGTLENGSLANGKLPATFLAKIEAEASSLAFHFADAVRINIAAVRANWPTRPQLAFDIRESGGFIIEMGVIKSGLGHGGISYDRDHTLWSELCQV
jgi:hypothetical protein